MKYLEVHEVSIGESGAIDVSNTKPGLNIVKNVDMIHYVINDGATTWFIGEAILTHIKEIDSSEDIANKISHLPLMISNTENTVREELFLKTISILNGEKFKDVK